MPPDKGGRVVFVGNIPYGLTEEQIIETFGSVGKVLSFRLVHDRETGKPKGFGFAEFQDADSASSAVRNLNDFEIMGRKLRVDFSHEGGEDDAAPAGYSAPPPLPQNGAAYPPPPPQASSGILPPLPPGRDLEPGLTCPDAISKTLATLPAPQLLDILSQMKGLVMQDPAKATELLKQAPQLSYALFQALLLMGLVDTTALQSVVEKSAQQGATPTPQLVQPQTILPPAAPPYPPVPPVIGGIQAPTPPMYGQPYQPPPPVIPQPQLPQQSELIQQVMNLSPEDLARMPEQDRNTVLMLRQRFMGLAPQR
ncbi:MAG: hypothetical protein M1824_001551 [Vezdaea acicularis]|nr:MAG: hypothetical protein M1824_001551 [Vezdaea acicularis]